MAYGITFQNGAGPNRGADFLIQCQVVDLILVSGCHRPVNADELFNLRHASARNVIERIFGVLKRRFRILVYPAEIRMDYQARIPAALAAIHNFIRIHDPDELEGFTDADDVEPGFFAGELAEGQARMAEKRRANARRDGIAADMWEQYQAELQFEERGAL